MWLTGWYSKQVVIQFLTRVVRDKTLCEVGAWSTGSAILNIINTILRTHPTNSIFKGGPIYFHYITITSFVAKNTKG